MKSAPSKVNLGLDFGNTNTIVQNNNQSLSTGFTSLDAMLPQGGWPVGAITEIFCPEDIAQTAPLVWPALAQLSQDKRWLALISPPHTPSTQQFRTNRVDLNHVLMIHPHATSNGLWAVEQALRAGTCAAVLSWVTNADHHALQDLRGAALAGNSCGLLFRPDWARHQPSTASLRLSITTDSKGIYVELLNNRTNKTKTAVFIEDDQLQHSA
jgi:cell division inhibitor SulA